MISIQSTQMKHSFLIKKKMYLIVLHNLAYDINTISKTSIDWQCEMIQNILYFFAKITKSKRSHVFESILCTEIVVCTDQGVQWHTVQISVHSICQCRSKILVGL